MSRRLTGPSVPISAVVLARSSATTTVAPEQPIEDVAQLFVAGQLTEMPVMDQGVALGVVTRDAVGETLAQAGRATPIGLVTLGDVIVVSPDASLAEVQAQLDARPGAVALVLDHGAPVGMVTREELDAYLAARAS